MTAKATFLGEEDAPEQIQMHGVKFKVGKAVDVSDDVAIRLMGNPFFKLDKAPEVEVPKPVQVIEAKPAVPGAPLPPQPVEKK